MTSRQLNNTQAVISTVLRPERTLLRIGAALAVSGIVLLVIAGFLHPPQADPGDSIAAFEEYALNDIWIATHLIQFFGALFVLGSLVALYRSIVREQGTATTLAWLGVAATASIAVAAILQAVDGIALKTMVDQWASAPEAEKAAALRVAESIRWIEIGVNSLFRILAGMTFLLFGLAIARSRIYPRWLGWVGVAAGLAWFLSGLAVAYNGFAISTLGTALGGLSYILLFVWLLILAALMWRRAGKELAKPDARSPVI
jgi:Domain of unknown function (DUF4386)